MDAGRIDEAGGAKRCEKAMSTIKLSIATSFLVLMSGMVAKAQTPTPSPATHECQIPTLGKVDKKLKILAKPEPKFSRRDRERHLGAEITLRAIFCGSGRVTDIVVTSGLTADMNAVAIEAARLIQFTPAEKNGNKASQVLLLKYLVQ